MAATDTGDANRAGAGSAGGELEAELARLLAVESFDPPAGFTPRQPEQADARDAAADPVGFWAAKARELLSWDKPFTRVLDDTNPPFYRWFDDGELNVSANCLDRHVAAGLGERVAYHWRGEEGERRDVTYAELLADTQKLANGLLSLGVAAGDVVGIYLPMIPEVAVAMLACARIGAVHNVVFGGFAPSAVRERMEVSDAKVLITVDGARRKGRTAAVKAGVDEEMADLPKLEHVVVVRSTGPVGGVETAMRAGRDVWYDELLAAADPVCPPAPLGAEHPLFILYSSGSTAKPKGILHTTGGYLLGATYTHRAVFDLDPETDVYWCSADVGWITGHSYIVYGPLSNGVTSVMYEGAPDYPDFDIWWQLIAEYKVTIFYTAPTAIRACIKWGAEYPARHDLSSLRVLGSVGEPINPKAWLWYHEVIGGGRCPIVDTWWQTETGSIMISPIPGITSTKPGSATRPLPGITPALLTEDGEPLAEGTGVLVITSPWPSMLRTLYRDDERFVQTYFSRFGPRTYLVGDAARLDADGYFWIIGRIDDVINVSGHRLSTAEVESALVSHEAVAEAAVVAQADADTGQAIVAFVTLRGDQVGDDDMIAELRDHVAHRIGKLARPRRVIWAEDLPKTRSGKIMRRLLRDVAEGRELGDVTTLRDPSVMAALAAKVATAPDE
ncbi:acetyl-CoA synthetase [Parafrankia irregularis]|uniref:Acetate--CoA ligase n=1 Tax=Parafrankia irregularis TaxID=795642 RepID=A0A0S4R1S9_9ACTN|nr:MULTISPECIES: acetate--CoA ligase [Parafrankia]MBE3205347.1 acetate--CoA ligase [Parafrankia sp. CH37]CUU60730.1 acetyl-CoA synthetase [Parafrankia irregularis]